MYECAELFCVLTNVSNKLFVFRPFPLRGGGSSPLSPPLRAPLTRTISRNQRLQIKTQENIMPIWPAWLSESGALKLMSLFSSNFSGALVNATA